MCTVRYYPLINEINVRLRVTRCYQINTNYQLLYLLSLSFPEMPTLSPSRSALLRYSGLCTKLLRQLTNEALDNYKRTNKLVIDSRMLVPFPRLGQHNLDTPSDHDGLISIEVNLRGRHR